MDSDDDNKTIYFVDQCETFKFIAIEMGNLFVKSLNLDKLTPKDKNSVISLKIAEVISKGSALHRPYYFQNMGHISRLYELMKKKGHLSHTQEMEKLQQAMIFQEEFYRLEQLLLEKCPMELTMPFQNIYLPGSISHLAGIDDKIYTLGHSHSLESLLAVLKFFDKEYHLLSHNTSMESFTRKIINSNWTKDHEIVQLACNTNIFRCVIDCLKTHYKHLTYAHIGRSGLFYSKKGNRITESGLSSAVLKNEVKKQCIKTIFM